MPGNLSTILIVAAIAMAVGIGGGWKWRDYQASEEALTAANTAAKDKQDALDKRDIKEGELRAVAADLEAKLAIVTASKQKAIIIREKEYVTKPIYAACPLPHDGVQLINERVAAGVAARAAGKRTGAVP